MKKLAVLLASLVLWMALAELAARRWLPVPALIFRSDPALLFEPVPGARKVMAIDPAIGGGRVVTEIGEDGFRGPPLRRPKDRPRVVVYGDSLVMADSVDLEATFVARLGAGLREGGAEVEAVNAGVTGYGPDQVCLKLEREIVRLEPDLVVLVLCAHNDFGDLVRNKIFSLDPGGDLATNRYALDESVLLDFAAKERATSRPALWRAFRRCLDLRRELELREAAGWRKPPYVEWYLAAGPDEFAEVAREGNLRVRTLFEDYYDADLAIHPEWESSLHKVRLMEGVIARIRDDCRLARVGLAVLVVPSAVDLVEDFEIRVDPAKHPTWSPARLTGTLAGILSRLEIPFLDLFGPFREAGSARLFMGNGDFHWNAAGQALAAERTAEFLRSSGLWPIRTRR